MMLDDGGKNKKREKSKYWKQSSVKCFYILYFQIYTKYYQCGWIENALLFMLIAEEAAVTASLRDEYKAMELAHAEEIKEDKKDHQTAVIGFCVVGVLLFLVLVVGVLFFVVKK